MRIRRATFLLLSDFSRSMRDRKMQRRFISKISTSFSIKDGTSLRPSLEMVLVQATQHLQNNDIPDLHRLLNSTPSPMHLSCRTPSPLPLISPRLILSTPPVVLKIPSTTWRVRLLHSSRSNPHRIKCSTSRSGRRLQLLNL